MTLIGRSIDVCLLSCGNSQQKQADFALAANMYATLQQKQQSVTRGLGRLRGYMLWRQLIHTLQQTYMLGVQHIVKQFRRALVYCLL